MKQLVPMKKFWLRYRFVFVSLIVWRFVLFVIELFTPGMWALKSQFTNPIHWANMDGGHYLFIARNGYGLFEQAFFPLYPMLIHALSFIPLNPVYIGILISHLALIVGMLLFYDMAYATDKKHALWAVALLLAFPTSFFFIAVYPTSLYFLLATLSFRAIQTRRWWLLGVSGLLASATRIFGVFLMAPAVIEYFTNVKTKRWLDFAALSAIPLGLFGYMYYLYKTTGDALKFAHVLPAYGTGRTGNEIILLPQVLWRYIKILFTANSQTVEFGIAMFELAVFLFFVFLLIQGLRTKLRKSYILYCAVVVFLSSLTGTFTSLPRYVLAAFPLFIVLGMGHNIPLKIALIGVMIIGLILCTSLYLQGYFVA